jgi:hypothetical protein
MNRTYLIPANSKKSQLIFSMFTLGDIIFFGIGILVTTVLLLRIHSDGIAIMVLKLLPALVTGILVMPIPNYHNVMGFFKSMINYLSNTKQYYWKGWCVKDVYGRDYEGRFNK